jgi:SET domain-containing protein
MFIPDNLELKESPIHGLGIFATKDIKQNDYLGDYIGIVMDSKSFREKYGKDTRYTYRLGRLHQYIVSKDNRNWINYINEKRSDPNVCLKKRGCVALKDISIGTELTLDYGKDYPRDY